MPRSSIMLTLKAKMPTFNFEKWVPNLRRRVCLIYLSWCIFIDKINARQNILIPKFSLTLR